jgi:hypothetical protein
MASRRTADEIARENPPSLRTPEKEEQVGVGISPLTKRRTERVLLRIPIEVRGTTKEGKAFLEKSHTLVINQHGALVPLRNGVTPGTQIRITNLQNKLECAFRVVEKAKKSLGEGPEWGVECLEPDLNFWGIFFPEKVARPAASESVDVLLECAACASRELAPLALEDYRAMAERGSLERLCAKCGEATEWRFGFAEGEEEITAPPSPEEGARDAASERRRWPRQTVKLPVRIRAKRGREELTRTENISKTGICFSTDLALEEGEAIQVTVGYSPGTTEKEVPARVVWRRELGGPGRALCGARLEGTE